MQKNEIIFYMRFVRTGSSTTTEHLKKNLKGYSCDENKLNKNKTVLMAGHLVHYGIHKEYPGRLYKYMTIMRDPAEWLLSVYNQDESRKKTGRDFEEWYNDSTPNTVCPLNSKRNKMLSFACWLFNARSLEECKKVLNECWFVGLTKNLDRELRLLSYYLGINDKWENYRRSGEYDEIEKIQLNTYRFIDKDLRAKIYNENPLDIELYNYAEKRNLETIGNINYIK